MKFPHGEWGKHKRRRQRDGFTGTKKSTKSDATKRNESKLERLRAIDAQLEKFLHSPPDHQECAEELLRERKKLARLLIAKGYDVTAHFMQKVNP